MIHDLDMRLAQWLDAGGPSLQQKIDEELGNRLDYYAAIGDMLSQRPIDIPRFTAAALNCWVLDRYTKMRLNAFARDEGYARDLITQLLDALPEDADGIAAHINEFIDYAVAGGFVDEKGYRDLAGAAALASLVLTAKYPDGFVDYPSMKRWTLFVGQLGYELPDFDTHGERMVWVSKLAQDIAAQRVFRRKWPDTEPMWVVSALCWSSGRGPYPRPTFQRGKTYRRAELHRQFGGQERGGISTPKEHPIIMLFTGETGEQFGYSDGWTEDGIFYYTGEGQIGPMTFERGVSCQNSLIP
jgi:hypothetical protein